MRAPTQPLTCALYSWIFFRLKFINFSLDPSARREGKLLTGTLLLLTSAVTGNTPHCTMLTFNSSGRQTDGIDQTIQILFEYQNIPSPLVPLDVQIITNHGDDSDGSGEDDSGVSLAHPPHQVALRASAGGGQWN